MAQIFLKLLNMSITAGIIVTVVIVLRLLLRRSPKWIRCILWGMVALRLILPFSIESDVSLVPETEPVREEIVYAEPVGAYTGIFALNTTLDVKHEGVESHATEPAEVVKEDVSFSIVDIASIVWLCGMGGMLIYASLSCVRISHRVREGVMDKDGIILCDRISAPFIFGIIRPRIYLPSDITESDRRYVIAHERAHIKRRDHLWKPFGYILLSIYWFNPLIWIGYILLCRDIELACDEKVIAELGEEDKKNYSTALINCSTGQRFVTACPVAFGETGVKTRVKTVLNYKKPAFWIIIIALVACVAVGIFFLTDPFDKEEENEEAAASVLIGSEDVQLNITELVVESGVYSFVQTAESAPTYFVGSDMTLYASSGEDEYICYGTLTECELNDESFDSRFDNFYFEGIDEIKNNNEKMWQVYSPYNGSMRELHILLLQNDGSVYIGYGYYDVGSNEPINFDDSKIRWLYKADAVKGNTPEVYRSVENMFHDTNTDSVLAIITEAYVCNDSPEEILKPTISLSGSNGRFQFTYSMFSSDLCMGTYEKTSNELILRTDDGENIYFFVYDGQNYRFDADRSSPIPKYKYSMDSEPEPPFGDDAVFSPKQVITPIIDSTEGDVDMDGVNESLTLTYGPTSGLFSFTLNMVDSDSEYHDMFITDCSTLSFTENEKGETVVKQDVSGETTRYLDIVPENNHLYLYEDGVSIVHLYAQGVEEYSYDEELAAYNGTVEMINVDMHESVSDISTAREAIIEANKRVRISYDRVSVGYDETADMWKVLFYNENGSALGNAQTVYVSSDRSTLAVIYGR